MESRQRQGVPRKGPQKAHAALLRAAPSRVREDLPSVRGDPSLIVARWLSFLGHQGLPRAFYRH